MILFALIDSRLEQFQALELYPTRDQSDRELAETVPERIPISSAAPIPPTT